MLSYTAWSADEIDAAVRRGQVVDQVAAALAMAWARVREGRRVSLVSDGISDEDTRALGFVPFRGLEEALIEALSRHGPDATIHVLPKATEILPVRA
jgi:hypothetical protein